MRSTPREKGSSITRVLEIIEAVAAAKEPLSPTALAERLPRLANATMRVAEWKGELVFLHEVAPGAADRLRARFPVRSTADTGVAVRG